MESRAKLFGHPIHQQLVVLPLGVLAMAVLFDLIGIVTDEIRWFDRSYWMIAAGVLSALVAAPFGLVDYLAIPRGTRAKSIGLLHGVGNMIVVLLFGASWFLRSDAPEAPENTALYFSFGGAVLSLLTGWLGGELVDRLGVGVDDGAHLNAPSSLSDRPADASEAHLRRA